MMNTESPRIYLNVFSFEIFSEYMITYVNILGLYEVDIFLLKLSITRILNFMDKGLQVSKGKWYNVRLLFSGNSSIRYKKPVQFSKCERTQVGDEGT